MNEKVKSIISFVAGFVLSMFVLATINAQAKTKYYLDFDMIDEYSFMDWKMRISDEVEEWVDKETGVHYLKKMNIEILDEMTKDELIEYCVALNDCLYTCEKIDELRNNIVEEQKRLAKFNESLCERLIEHMSNNVRLDVIETKLTKTYSGHIKPAKIKSYRKSDKLDVEVMDLDNDPETDKKPESNLEEY